MCLCIRKEAFQLRAVDCQHSDRLTGLYEVTKRQIVVVVSIWSTIMGNSCYTILVWFHLIGVRHYLQSHEIN